MQLQTLDLAKNYDHVYLSPHLDDAPLSCGGAIAAQIAAGERVLVITLCTAAPPAAGPFSVLAQQFHADWGLTPDQVVTARLREEQLAMERLGVDYHWAGRLDAIYRHPEAYNSRESLFNRPAQADPLFADLRAFFAGLAQQLAGARFYAPLGIGNHVDHLITHTAIRDTIGAEARFYEDLPYVAKPGAFEQRMSQLEGIVSSVTRTIDATLPQKLRAIHAYASQLKELFGGPEAMERVISEYAASLEPSAGRYGERVWQIGAV